MISERIAVFPGDTSFRRRALCSFQAGDHLALSSIETTLHLGAHADAPWHYHPRGVGISERAISRYIGPAQVIRVPLGRGQRLRPEDLKGRVIQASRVLFATDTFTDPNSWQADFGSFSASLIEFLADQGVKLVGIDTPSIDLADDRLLESHQAVYHRDLAVLEGLVLEGIEEGLYTLFAQPLRIEGADASPVRAVLSADRGVFEAFLRLESINENQDKRDQ
ncbi:MAG: hypothetical protein RJB38_774 [Pseudomonadota bacterium]